MSNRAVWKYALYTVHLLLILALMSSGVYLFNVSRPRLEQFVRQRSNELLPPRLEYNHIDVGFFPFNVYVRGLSLKRTGDVSMDVDTLRLKPDLWKLTAGILQLKSLSLHSPTLNLHASPRRIDLRKAVHLLHELRVNLDEMLVIPGVLSTIRVRDATVHLRGSTADAKPLLTFRPLRFTVGPVHLAQDTGTLRVRMRSKLFDGRGKIRLTGTIRAHSDRVNLEGRLNASDVTYRQLAPLLDWPPHRGSFRLSGQFPFRIETDVLRLRPSRFTFRRLRGDPFGFTSREFAPPGADLLRSCEKITGEVRAANFAIEPETKGPRVSLRQGQIRPTKLELKSLDLIEPEFVIAKRKDEEHAPFRNLRRLLNAPSPPVNGFGTSIERLRVRRGTLRWPGLDPDHPRDPTLEPIFLTAGPLRPGDGPESMNFQVRGRLDQGGLQFRTRGNLRPDRPSSLELEGNLRFDELRVNRLRTHFTGPFPLRTGQITGSVPFSLRDQRVHLGKTTLVVEAARSAADPGRKMTRLVRSLRRQGASAPAPFRRLGFGSAESIRLRLRDWRWTLYPLAPSTRIELREGHLEVKRLTPDLARTSVRGELRFKHPHARLSLGGQPVGRRPRKNLMHIWAHLDLPRLSELNPFLKPERLFSFPFRVNQGRLRSRTRGVVSPGSLDLTTDLSFRKLDLVQTRPDRTKVLKTSPTMFLWYLYHTGGELDLRLKIDGNPLQPTFHRVDR